jgi:hypothetical protein
MRSPREVSATLRVDADRIEKYGPSQVAAALRAVADILDEATDKPGAAPAEPAVPLGICDVTWRERLWTVPSETRLGAREVAEALGRGIDFVYRHTGPGTSNRRIPHQKIDGALVFVVAEVRDWLRQAETAISTPVHLHSRRRSNVQRNPWEHARRDGNTVPPKP